MRVWIFAGSVFYMLQGLALEIILSNREPGVKEFVAGDLVKVTLKTSFPQGVAESLDFAKFLEKKRLGPFSIVGHGSIESSSRDLAAQSIDLDIVLIDEVQDERQLFYSYQQSGQQSDGQSAQKRRVPIKLEGLSYRFVGFSPQVNILELELQTLKHYGWWAGLAVFLLLLASTGGGRYLYCKQKKSRIEKKRRQEAQALFSNLEDRQQLELIYRKRKLWAPYAEGSSQEHFCNVLNRYQYRKHWNAEELAEVCRAAKNMEAKLNG